MFRVGRVPSLVLLVVGTLLAAAGPAAAAPAPRVFPEPIASTDFIAHGAATGPSQLADGFRELERRHPGYLRFTTVDRELGDPDAVSLGPDARPRWDAADTGDGLPFYVAIVTDESVPDRDKEYVLLMNAHPAEPCGQEGDPRFLEDLLTWRAEQPDRILDDGAGLTNRRDRLTVRELLRKVKIYFVSTSPDDWLAADDGGADNENNAGFNENRVAFQDGWVFPAAPLLFDRGYSTLTQPEGAAVTRYLAGIRQRELGGRSFAVANDQHGPLPSSGALIFHDQGNDPAKLDRLHDYARRLEENMEEVFARYFTGIGTTASQELARQAGDVRDVLLRTYTSATGEPVSEKALFLTLEWAEYATAWEHLDYTVVGSWGGWAGSRSGAGADSISFETACDAQSGTFQPALFQMFVDNVRAANETGVVYAAHRTDADGPRRVTTYDLGGRVGFVETGARVSDRDGNPSPPPPGHPGSPLVPAVTQTPYDVSNTDYFRDLRPIVSTPIVEVPAARVAAEAGSLDTLVVPDTTDVDAAALARFARRGGNVVLTDRALGLLPALVGVPADGVRRRHAYVGYSDLDRSHPWTQGLYKRARQMFDPVGLGLPLLMERDQYWPCSTTCDVSPTTNSAPIWSVARDAFAAAGGVTIGTADVREDRKSPGEGTATDRTTIGTVKLGEGRVVIFGGLLPTPSEAHDHWFGLDAYTVSIPGQQLLLAALRWDDGAALAAPRRCQSRRRFVVSLPRSIGRRRVVRGRVTVDGRRVAVRRSRGRLVALVDLRHRERGKVTVRVTSITRSGQRRTDVRTFRTCTPRADTPARG